MNILLTGGAGYIGSIMTRMLLEEGYFVVVVDNLSRGHKDAVDKRAKFVRADIRSSDTLAKIMGAEDIEAVMHFAGVILMEESMRKPCFYFQNNVCGALGLFSAMGKAGVEKVIFSSSAGVYGDAEDIPIKEDAEKNPTNPYGESKLAVERILRWLWETKGLASISLRYYNPAGASLDKRLGERHEPESHIIPLALRAAKIYLSGAKQRSHPLHEIGEFYLYGDDYPTKDGTCIRDYIHIVDLCKAHLAALKSLCQQPRCDVYNVGTGRGWSNMEVIEAVKKTTGVDFPVKVRGRRAGDAAELVADARKIKNELGWEPKHSNLEEIVRSAWEFENMIES